MEQNGCKPNAITYRHLALGLKAGLMKETLKTLDLGNDLSASTKIRKSTPWLEITLSIVEIFAENGDIENAEKLFEELKKANYTRCGMYPDIEKSTTTTTTIAGVAPPVKMHSEGSEKSSGAEGGHGCDCGSNCECDPCNC
ncbi:Pentatricopeptide repeat-containing protein [Camellia lanceoleosa]|uniref:Pentatricopeptide repeat-containing protein n=1 Tax=Camellia lanceoleosa TaxID=1840588 RepID=A0ACC0HSH8_9ERIC|nr:Pentatricopeptide repeat-containing protein [Camellia lanceoleosa]